MSSETKSDVAYMMFWFSFNCSYISNRFKITVQFKWRAAKKLYMFHVLLIYSIHIAFLHITQTHSLFYWLRLFFILFVKFMRSFDFVYIFISVRLWAHDKKIILFTFLCLSVWCLQIQTIWSNRNKDKICCPLAVSIQKRTKFISKLSLRLYKINHS